MKCIVTDTDINVKNGQIVSDRLSAFFYLPEIRKEIHLWSFSYIIRVQ